MRRWSVRANPIYQAERLYWQRSKTSRTLNGSFLLVLGAVLVLFTVRQDTGWAGQAVLLVMIAIHTLHLIVSFLAVSSAYDSIDREQRSQSWDLLRVTPLTRETLVWGKLWAVLDWLAPLYLRLIGLKLVFLLWQFTQIYSAAHTAMRRSASVTSNFQDDQFLALSAVAVLFVMVYLLADMLFTTALGLTVALVMPPLSRRSGLVVGLMVRWWLPLLTLAAMLTYEAFGIDPLPTHWNSHVSLAARYADHMGFDYIGYWGAVAEVFPALAITMPDGPLLAFMHATSLSHIETTGAYGFVLLCSLVLYLGLALAAITAGRLAARLHYP